MKTRSGNGIEMQSKRRNSKNENDNVDEEGGMTECGHCQLNLQANLAMKCDGFCKHLFHPECVNVDVELFCAINELTNHVKWFCFHCQTKIDMLFNKSNRPKLDETCDWPMVLNIVLDQLELQSQSNLDLSYRMDTLSEQYNKVSSKLADISSKYEVLNIDSSTTKPIFAMPRPSSGTDTGLSDQVSPALTVDPREQTLSGVSNHSSSGPSQERVGKSEVMSHPYKIGGSNGRVFTNSRYDRQDVHNMKNQGKNDSSTASGWQGAGYRRGYNRRQVNNRSQYNEQRWPRYGTNNGLPSVPISQPTSSPVNDVSHPESSKPSYSQVVKSKVIHGSMDVKEGGPTCLKAAKRMFWMYLSGCDPSVDSETVVAHLKSLNDSTSYVCDKLKTKYDSYSSFKVGIPYELAEELMHPNLWPQGCVVGKYRAPRNRPGLNNGRPTISNNDFLAQTSPPLIQS